MAYEASTGHVIDDVTWPVAGGRRCAPLAEVAVSGCFSNLFICLALGLPANRSNVSICLYVLALTLTIYPKPPPWDLYCLRSRWWGGCVCVLQMFFSVFLFFFRPTKKNTRQPFSGTAERIFMKLLPNDSGKNVVYNVVPKWGLGPK